ncbi:MAG: ankyrin repeat domain-containing protein [Acidobacteriota bacterium]
MTAQRICWLLATMALVGVGALPVAAEPDLMAAVKAGDVAAARQLLRRSAAVDATQPDGTTALMWAVRDGNRPMAALLIKAGAHVNAANRYGVTPLSMAVSQGHPEALGLLLGSGADVKTAEATLPDGQTLLMLGARTGNVEILKRLIERGANPNAVERRAGTSAVMWAVMGNHADAVQALVAAGADLNARSRVTRYPHTPPAVIGDKLEEGVSYVGQTVLPKGGWTALMYAAREGAVNAARVLAGAGADLNATEPEGTSALLFAIINGHYDVAEVLIEAGADLDLADRTGMTPLYAAVDMHTLGSTFGRPDPQLAVIDGSVPMIEFLLQHGANPDAGLRTKVLKRVYNAGDARLGEGSTPFMRAARGGDVAVMRLLLQYGANPALTLKNGTTPIMLAASLATNGNYPDRGTEESAIQAITLCLGRHLDVNAVNGTGDTAVHVAIGSPAIVRFLAGEGARLDIKNTRGQTPLDAARANRNATRTVDLLRELTGAPADAASATAPRLTNGEPPD